ncbi:hypothetical protein [uncultured Shimia sp.]|uniref:hypothetical protein n=1 Tax=Shimia sp. MIT1388 TaxID=3096992 RepID=UPI0026201B7E|nr:hypothetical protein [uncultured Shimia sp.]
MPFLARVLTTATLSLTALPALAANAPSDKLLKLIRDNGCQMTAVEAGEMLPKHGFTPDQTRDIIRDWDEKGWLDGHGFAGIKLSDAGCKG